MSRNPSSSGELKALQQQNLKHLVEADLPDRLEASTDSKVYKDGGKVAFGLLPHITCPGRTEFCKDCYVKTTYRYKNVPRLLARNTALLFELQKKKDWAGMDRSLEDMVRHSKGAKLGFFRIHWSGDFFSQDYLASWFRVIEKFPTVKFWVYTRSFHLDFSKKPGNLTIYASTDQYNAARARLFQVEELAAEAFSGEIVEQPVGMIGCPHLDKKVKDCATCGLCMKSTSVFFRRHY